MLFFSRSSKFFFKSSESYSVSVKEKIFILIPVDMSLLVFCLIIRIH